MTNVKKVKITIPNEAILKRIISTPTLNRLSKNKLQVGENIENVNHFQFSNMLRMYPLLNVGIIEIL